MDSFSFKIELADKLLSVCEDYGVDEADAAIHLAAACCALIQDEDTAHNLVAAIYNEARNAEASENE